MTRWKDSYKSVVRERNEVLYEKIRMREAGEWGRV